MGAGTEFYFEYFKFAIEAKKHPLDFKPVKMNPTINNFFVHIYLTFDWANCATLVPGASSMA